MKIKNIIATAGIILFYSATIFPSTQPVASENDQRRENLYNLFELCEDIVSNDVDRDIALLKDNRELLLKNKADITSLYSKIVKPGAYFFGKMGVGLVFLPAAFLSYFALTDIVKKRSLIKAYRKLYKDGSGSIKGMTGAFVLGASPLIAPLSAWAFLKLRTLSTHYNKYQKDRLEELEAFIERDQEIIERLEELNWSVE